MSNSLREKQRGERAGDTPGCRTRYPRAVTSMSCRMSAFSRSFSSGPSMLSSHHSSVSSPSRRRRICNTLSRPTTSKSAIRFSQAGQATMLSARGRMRFSSVHFTHQAKGISVAVCGKRKSKK
eukprot:3380571-Rhodomonas_salina.1